MDAQQLASAWFWGAWKLAPLVAGSFAAAYALIAADFRVAWKRAFFTTIGLGVGLGFAMGLLIDHWYPPSSFSAGFFLPFLELPLSAVVGLVVAFVCQRIVQGRNANQAGK